MKDKVNGTGTVGGTGACSAFGRVKTNPFEDALSGKDMSVSAFASCFFSFDVMGASFGVSKTKPVPLAAKVELNALVSN